MNYTVTNKYLFINTIDNHLFRIVKIDKLRSYRSKGDKNTKNVPKTEMMTFKKGPEMLATLDRIGERIGLQSPLTYGKCTLIVSFF